MAKKTSKITVIRDTREKEGCKWRFKDFPRFEFVDRHLDTGDYSVMGHEGKFVIERKKSFTELAQNLVSKDRFRFNAEMDRIQQIHHRFIIVEIEPSDLARGSRFTKVTGNRLISLLAGLQIQGIHVIFGGDQSEYMAGKLIERYMDGIDG